MKRLILTIFLCIIFGLNNLYSQKIKDLKPEKVTIADFSVIGNRSAYLWYSSIFSYPYSLPNNTCGARDCFFSVKNDTYIRILLNKNDTSSGLFALHKFYNSIPELIEVVSYYQVENEVISNNIKGTTIINYYDKGCFFDLSTLRDITRNVIVDIKFSYPIFSRKEINFYRDKKLDYKSLYIRIDVPEIYKYNIEFDDGLLSYEITKPKSGRPIIGYIPIRGLISKSGFISLNSWNYVYNLLKTDVPIYQMPEPYYCNLYSHIFVSKEPIDSEIDNDDNNFSPIIEFRLDKINEILHW